MGREIKRIMMDFDWPLNKTWGGYLNPFYKQSINCPQCDGYGRSPEAKRLSDQWYGNAPFQPSDRGSKPWTPIDAPVRAVAERNCHHSSDFYGSDENAIYREANRLCALWNAEWSHHLNADDVAVLVKANRLHDFTHIWTQEKGWQLKDPPYLPTSEEVNAWSISSMGRDAINQWVCVEAECKRLGYPTECARCKGEGSLWPSLKIKQQAEDWERTEPPEGEGYQLWETVSEGSPISPVFATAEELAEWIVTSPDYKWRKNDKGITREQWLKFIIGPGWCPSLIMVDGRVMTGVEAWSSGTEKINVGHVVESKGGESDG